MNSHIIRRALPDDAASLSVFAARLFRSTYSDDTAATDLDAYIEGHLTAGHFAAEIADPEGAVFLAMAGDAIAGYIHLLARADEGPLAVLNRIYVDSAFRGSGLSGALLQAVIDEAKRRDAARLQLTVYERNKRAIAFYEKMGFVTVGTTTFVVGDDPQTDFVMQLRLT